MKEYKYFKKPLNTAEFMNTTEEIEGKAKSGQKERIYDYVDGYYKYFLSYGLAVIEAWDKCTDLQGARAYEIAMALNNIINDLDEATERFNDDYDLLLEKKAKGQPLEGYGIIYDGSTRKMLMQEVIFRDANRIIKLSALYAAYMDYFA